MNIPIKMGKDFETCLAACKEKYGEDFEYLNGFHESQLNFSDFIDGFIDRNVADVTIDANANAKYKDICSMCGEKGKSEDKLFAFNKIFYELKKKYGLRVAKEWLEAEYSGKYYLHDAPSASYKPYCFTGDTTIITNNGIVRLDSVVGKQIKVLNKNKEWEDATVEHFGKDHIKILTLRRKGVDKKINVTGNHKWFVKRDDKEVIMSTDKLLPGYTIPCNYVTPPNHDKGPDWTVVSVKDTGRVEDVYCAVVPGTESFTLDDGVLTHNCYAYDLTRLAKEGLFFLKEYNNEAPRHLTTFLDDTIEFVSFMSNRSSGACGLPNVLLWTFYFWKKDVEAGYMIKDPVYYIKQSFQKFIFRLNQPFLRRLCAFVG